MVSTTQRERSDRCGVPSPTQNSLGEADNHPLNHSQSVLKERTPRAKREAKTKVFGIQSFRLCNIPPTSKKIREICERLTAKVLSFKHISPQNGFVN